MNSLAFVLSSVYVVVTLRSSDTSGSDVLTCSTIILSAWPVGLQYSLLLSRDECGSQRRLVAGLKGVACRQKMPLALVAGMIGESVWILVSNFAKVPVTCQHSKHPGLSCRSNVFGVWLDNQYEKCPGTLGTCPNNVCSGLRRLGFMSVNVPIVAVVD